MGAPPQSWQRMLGGTRTGWRASATTTVGISSRATEAHQVRPVFDDGLQTGACKLIADDARFCGRGRPAFLVTTDQFLQVIGLGSLTELPARGALSTQFTTGVNLNAGPCC